MMETIKKVWRAIGRLMNLNPFASHNNLKDKQKMVGAIMGNETVSGYRHDLKPLPGYSPTEPEQT